MRAVVVVGVFLASLLVPPIANAEPSCEGGAFAVGGYPKTGQVPDGYQAVDTPGGIAPWDAGGYTHGQQVGAANMIEAVDTYAAACPDAEIRLHGYSYGAAIVHTAVETIDQRDYAPRVHVELKGNPRRPGGVEDTWSWLPPIAGIDFRGAGATPQNVATFEDKCNVGADYVCSAPHPIDIIGSVSGSIGYGTGGHSYR